MGRWKALSKVSSLCAPGHFRALRAATAKRTVCESPPLPLAFPSLPTAPSRQLKMRRRKFRGSNGVALNGDDSVFSYTKYFLRFGNRAKSCQTKSRKSIFATKTEKMASPPILNSSEDIYRCSSSPKG